MYITNSLITITTLLAAIGNAMPAPAPTQRPESPSACMSLDSQCSASAHRFCRTALPTATTTIFATTTITLFNSFGPCCAPDYATIPPFPWTPPTSTPIALAKRTNNATATIPPCLSPIITGINDPALTSACACVDAAQRTLTSTVTQTVTAAATPFFLQYPSNGQMARESQVDNKTVALFGNAGPGPLNAYQMNDNCNLADSQGRVAFGPVSRSSGSVQVPIVWEDSSAVLPNMTALQCSMAVIWGGLSARLRCRPVDGFRTQVAANGVWIAASDGNTFMNLYPYNGF